MLATIEKKTLIWLAQRMPAWVNSDHLTLLGFVAMFAAGLCYWAASCDRADLIAVIVALAVNWFGDSLDGTLARVRNRLRPRYGFYVDHITDAIGTFFLMGGLALSSYMSPYIALGPADRLLPALHRSLPDHLHDRLVPPLLLEFRPHRTAAAAVHREHRAVLPAGGGTVRAASSCCSMWEARWGSWAWG